ncbi:MAG TPA: hypothetical protein ACN46L_02355 [Prochlorococcus sp.]|nr:hypothetical protein [Prochlorococcaceae cyanobacterium ETNP14_MAG_5]
MNDEDWKEQYKQWKEGLKPFQIKLLDEGSQSQSQQWLINAMWCDWKDLKESRQNEAPQNQHQETLCNDPWKEEEESK